MFDRKVWTKQWRLNNKTKINERSRSKRKANSERYKGYDLKKDFGLTIAEYNLMLAKQDGHCAICSCTPEQNGQALCVDHKHAENYKSLPSEDKVKYVRGLLCTRHNLMLGLAEDNIAELESSAKYLKERNK
jgi:hypothetical protein